MKARIFCNNSPDFPGTTVFGTPTLSVVPTRLAGNDSGPSRFWACEILDGPFDGHPGPEKKDLAGAVLFGILLGFLLCSIPLFVLLRKAKAAEEEDEDYEYGNRDYTDAGTVAGGNAQD
ncbi:hypothetical protein B0H15DRAFT_944482 [Mycena belliarum]|uniref:Uncharacterized protein n=1 Tax=Mycena belliarum TaxID=1033014 RepID=A0AAD6UDQ5_9AGAR|nr:hypothetical protein B0H15DRAFT_944482 [Mycena belliae]